MSENPSFAVIIEWDNARLTGAGRARRMLGVLQRQILALPAPVAGPEIIILYDRHAVDPSIIESARAQAIDPGAGTIDIRLVGTDGLGYYEQKNFGATLTDREIIIYLDSDVVPQSGWLAALLNAIQRPDIHVVCGNTFIDASDRYAKAFALMWFFPLTGPGTDLIRTNQFFANNVAFKRAFFLQNPFPDLPVFRGQCQILSQAIVDLGHGIYLQQSASVSHPPPKDISHFVRRALCEGHDGLILGRLRRAGTKTHALSGALPRFVSALGRTFRRVVRHGRSLGLSALDLVFVLALALTYYALRLAGEMITIVNPGLIRKYASI